MTLRCEIFPSDLDATVDFYTRVLRFAVTKDQRQHPNAYVAMQRGAVQLGAARRAVPDGLEARRPPAGVELGCNRGRPLPARNGEDTGQLDPVFRVDILPRLK